MLRSHLANFMMINRNKLNTLGGTPISVSNKPGSVAKKAMSVHVKNQEHVRQCETIFSWLPICSIVYY